MTLTRRTALAGAAVASLATMASLATAEERHPKIRAAIRALEEAKQELEHAAHDFGGHRAQALAECDRAIEQLRLALQYDRQ
jgi:F0F1-type ATP synthase membrane subunit b/b'